MWWPSWLFSRLYSNLQCHVNLQKHCNMLIDSGGQEWKSEAWQSCDGGGVVWEEKAYIKPHSSSGLQTLETDTEQEQQTNSDWRVSSTTSTSTLACCFKKRGIGRLTQLARTTSTKGIWKKPSSFIQTSRMSAHAMEMSHLNALAVHRMSLAMEEFPLMVGLSRSQDCDRAHSVLQWKKQFSCDDIAEEGEWGRTAHSGGRQSTAQLLAVTWESAQMHASTSVNLGACRLV